MLRSVAFGLLAAIALLAGCSGSSTSTKAIVGSYTVTITRNGVSDPDVLTIRDGSAGSLLITFVAGVTTDPMGPNADGLRASIDGSKIDIKPQPAHIDHSTGNLDGTLSGTLMVTAGTLSGSLAFVPSSGLITDADGGAVQLGDGGALAYELMGTKD